MSRAAAGSVGAGTARNRLLATLAFLIVLAALPPRAAALHLVLAIPLVVLAVLTRMPPRFLLPRLLVAEPVILAAALAAWLSPDAGERFLAVLLKAHLSLLAVLLLAWTTPFPALLAALRLLRLPAVLRTTLALLHRYLPVLAEESTRMQRARASRTFSRSRGRAWSSLAGIVGLLFVRAANRAERIYLAMCARGWQ